MSQKTSSNHSKQFLIIEDMTLPAPEGDTYRNIRLVGAALPRETTDHNYFDAEVGPCQQTVQIAGSATLDVKYLLRSSSPMVEHAKLRTLEGDDKRCSFHPGNNTGTPAVGDPLFGFYAAIKPHPQLGGDIGTAAQVEVTHMVSGDFEELEAVIPVPTSVAAGSPTSTTIDITWDAVGDFLTTYPATYKIRGFNVYRSGTTGGPVTDPYVKVNTAEVANPGGGTVTYQDTGLTASTTYFYVVRAIWEFGYPSADSTEVTETTTA